jgi:hypothetical protein
LESNGGNILASAEGQADLTVTRTLRYAIITVGIIVATVGVRKKNNGLLLLGAAIIA